MKPFRALILLSFGLLLGEACLHNVWNRLARDHLLTLLHGRRVLRPAL